MTFPVPAARRLAAAAALGCGTLLLSACGSSGGSSASSTSTVTVTTAPSTSAAAAPSSTAAGTSSAPTTAGGGSGCASSALKVSIGAGNGTAGSVVVPVQLTNTSSSTCTLYGFPGVSFVSGPGGSTIGKPAGEDSSTSRELVTLAPGAEASAQLNVVVAQNYPASRCHLARAHWLRVYPPGQTAPLYVKYSSDTCVSTKISILQVQAVRAGSGNP
jgi:hypothetical protein